MPDVTVSDGLTIAEDVIVRRHESGNPFVLGKKISSLKIQKQAPYPLPKNLKARLPRSKPIKHKYR